MGWAEIRKKARRTVHSTFSLSAIYTSKAGVVYECKARMHNEMREFGDLDREGFVKNMEDVNHVIFDALEVEPEKGATVQFPDYEDAVFNIVNILPKSTDEFRRVEVTLE